MSCCINAKAWPYDINLKCPAPLTADALGVNRQQKVHTARSQEAFAV